MPEPQHAEDGGPRLPVPPRRPVHRHRLLPASGRGRGSIRRLSCSAWRVAGRSSLCAVSVGSGRGSRASCSLGGSPIESRYSGDRLFRPGLFRKNQNSHRDATGPTGPAVLCCGAVSVDPCFQSFRYGMGRTVILEHSPGVEVAVHFTVNAADSGMSFNGTTAAVAIPRIVLHTAQEHRRWSSHIPSRQPPAMTGRRCRPSRSPVPLPHGQQLRAKPTLGYRHRRLRRGR